MQVIIAPLVGYIIALQRVSRGAACGRVAAGARQSPRGPRAGGRRAQPRRARPAAATLAGPSSSVRPHRYAPR